MTTTPHPRLLPLSSLRISTRFRLHPEFIAEPGPFALRHRIHVANDMSPETSFKKDHDHGGKATKVKSNIHLVQYKAIRLFTERDDVGDWVRSIDVNPAVLLYGNENHPLAEPDLLLSLSILLNTVTPLLAVPEDACHIVPGLVAKDAEHVAYWKRIESEVVIPELLLPCLHLVGHPDAGEACGTTKKLIQLGERRGGCVISFETIKKEVVGSAASEMANSLRVRLSLSSPMLSTKLGSSGAVAKMKDIDRLIKFRAAGVAEVHQGMMSGLTGSYLPVPPEWVAGNGKAVTPARIIALLSRITPIPLHELRTMDEDLRHPSPATRTRLNQDVPDEAAHLKRIPLSSLFPPEVYAVQVDEWEPPADDQIDPRVAAAYGPASPTTA